MNRRFCLYLIPVIALLLVAAASCAPPAPTGSAGPAATQAPAAPAAAPAATEVPAASGAIQFFTWAEDDFEQKSLEQLVKSFKIPTNLVVVR